MDKLSELLPNPGLKLNIQTTVIFVVIIYHNLLWVV